MKAFISYIYFLLLPVCVFGQAGTNPSPNSAPDSSLIKEWLSQSALLLKTNTEASLQVAQKALAFSEKTHNGLGKAQSFVAIGSVYFTKKDYTAALNHFEKAKSIFSDTGNEVELGKLLKTMGDVYAVKSVFRQSFDHYREAITYLRKTRQLKLMNECQDAMGKIALDFGQTAGAIGHYKRSLAIKTALNDTEGILTTTAKIAKIHLSQKQYDSAYYYNRAVQRMAKDDAAVLTDAVIDEFVILSFQGKLAEAALLRKSAERWVSRQQNPTDQIKLWAATSNYYLAQKDKQTAGKYFDSAAVAIEKARSPELAVAGLSLLAEMSSQNEDYKTAFRMLKLMDRYKDIFRSEHIETISAEIRNTAEARLSEKQIEFLNLQNKLADEKLDKAELLRLALKRENLWIDSSLKSQLLLTDLKTNESNLRNRQLSREKELSQSLSRENQLKQKLLNDEHKNQQLLWLGMCMLALAGGVIFWQYKKQSNKNRIIQKQAAELSVLNKEIHHRVKNNLQVISSMLDLQSQNLKDTAAKAILKEGVQRVQSMAFIHQNLYRDNAVNSVNINEYIDILSSHLFQTYNIRTDKIRFHTHIENLNLHTDTAIPLGMILNELISNALKYAFRNAESGDIWVTMQRSKDQLLLRVQDNGRGLPKEFDPDNTATFGYEMIRAFLQKMKAQMSIDGSHGTDVKIFISKFKTID
ncbi:MAG: histidine kinase dimerization/phosphoacceptor domain -containing protein [Spirosomataceae bacterium]